MTEQDWLEGTDPRAMLMEHVKTAVLVAGYRSVLEDRAEVVQTSNGLVVVVADGAGGRSGGADAAEIMVRRASEAASFSQPPDPMAWCRILADIDQAILSDPKAGETTAVVASISSAGVGGASVGDSGAWLIMPEGRHDLTGRQHRKPFLGSGVAVPFPFFAALPPCGTLLVASDGLLKYAAPERICEVAREAELETATRHLVDLVRLQSGKLQDDVAVILCRPVASLW